MQDRKASRVKMLLAVWKFGQLLGFGRYRGRCSYSKTHGFRRGVLLVVPAESSCAHARNERNPVATEPEVAEKQLGRQSAYNLNMN